MVRRISPSPKNQPLQAVQEGGHPLAPALSSANDPRSNSSGCRVESRVLPIVASVARGTHPGLHSLGCRVPRTRTSHPSGSRLGDYPIGIIPRPVAPKRPRKPSVPSRVQFNDRRDMSATAVEQMSGLRSRRPRQPLDGSRLRRTRSTTFASHRRHAGNVTFAAQVKSSMRNVLVARHVQFVQGRNRRPNQDCGSQPDPLPGSPIRPRLIVNALRTSHKISMACI